MSGQVRSLIAVFMQGARFGIVGVTATLTHVMVFTGLIELLAVRPLYANFLAFLVAFLVSFSGHLSWTFKAPDGRPSGVWKAQMLKFLTVALTGLALNSGCVYLVVDILSRSYIYAIALMVTLVPGIIFVLSKYWAFSIASPE